MIRRTRRQLLAGAAGAAAAAAGAGALLDRGGGETAARALAGGRLRKCISLSGPAPLIYGRHPNDYRYHGNREYVRDLSGTRWVKLWVSWRDLQEGFQPQRREESWAQLEQFRAPTGAGVALRELDRQVRAANDDSRALALRGGSLGVILTIYQAFPTWATGAGESDPRRAGKPLEAKLPEDLSPDGPWGWFVEHLLRRYRRGAPRNPGGAAIDLLEVCNEPNFLHWPQVRIGAATAQMIRSAAELSARHGGTPLLAPATSDFPDEGHLPAAYSTDWRSFSEEVLARLSERRLPVPVGWSHHDYQDCKYGGDRAARVARMLREGGRALADERLWITEGGYDMPDPADTAELERQAALIARSHAQATALPQAYMWTQHGINDVPSNDFKSGLRGDFDYGRGLPGPVRPAWDTWRRLPAAASA